MKKLITILLIGAVLAPFHAGAADTGMINEVFACTLKEGKTWDDWREVNAFFGESVKKVGGAADDFFAYAWRPFRGGVEFDYLWSGYYENLRVLGESWEAFDGTPEATASSARWEALEDCRSALLTLEQIYDAPDFPADNTATTMLESFRCTLQPGKSLADVQAALEPWKAHAAAVDLPLDVFLRTPLVSGSDIDHSYFVLHENAAAYGANMSAWLTHPDTAGIDAMLDEVQDCTNQLWRSEPAFLQDE